MKNFVANGNSLQIPAPAGGLVGGQVVAVGKVVGVVVASAAEGEQCTVQIRGAFNDLPKETGTAWSRGDMLYLKADGSSLTKTATSNTFAGYAYEDAAAGDAKGSLLLSH